MLRFVTLALAVGHLSPPTPAAQKSQPHPSKGKAVNCANQNLSEQEDADCWRKLEAERDFAGLKFGAGVSLTVGMGGRDRVESAELVSNIVRITEERNEIPRVLLETHYIFPSTERHFLGLPPASAGVWGWGPFVGLQNGENEVIQAIGTGVMFAFRSAEEMHNRVSELKRAFPKNRAEAQASATGERSKHFNVGLGFIRDSGVKTLGDGIDENKPLPAGETEVRFKKSSWWGGLLLFSFGF